MSPIPPCHTSARRGPTTVSTGPRRGPRRVATSGMFRLPGAPGGGDESDKGRPEEPDDELPPDEDPDDDEGLPQQDASGSTGVSPIADAPPQGSWPGLMAGALQEAVRSTVGSMGFTAAIAAVRGTESPLINAMGPRIPVQLSGCWGERLQNGEADELNSVVTGFTMATVERVLLDYAITRVRVAMPPCSTLPVLYRSYWC